MSIKPIHSPKKPKTFPDELVADDDNAADYPHDLDSHNRIRIAYTAYVRIEDAYQPQN